MKLGCGRNNEHTIHHPSAASAFCSASLVEWEEKQKGDVEFESPLSASQIVQAIAVSCMAGKGWIAPEHRCVEHFVS